METRKLGSTGPEVSGLGLGCMGMSDAYGPADRSESLATLHAALDAGITLFDTGDFYGSGSNELLLGEAFTGVPRNQYQLSVKFGSLRDPNGGWGPVDGRPASIKNFLAYSLKRLRVDYIDVYRAARLDPTVPIEETIGALSDCVQMGWIRYVGLSEVGAETLRRAHAVHPIADLQIEYSLLTRDIESAILPTCRDLGIGITAYGVLSRGLLSGFRLNGDQDFRAQMPRFQGDNLKSNLAVVEGLRTIASDMGATTTELAIAWVLAQGSDVVPLVGARRRQQLSEAVNSLKLTLTNDDLNALEHIVPTGTVQGARYPEAMLARLDSEHE
jgi:aryl-alcohol dehydrogenase-like predicted oxidoreductase